MSDLSWLGTFGGVIVSSLITIVIFCINLRRSNSLAAQERKRHEGEISRLKAESKKAEERHEQQINAMLKQGRREREVRFLQELSDYLLEFSAIFGSSVGRERSLLCLQQYALKVRPDFDEDDDVFAQNVSHFLSDLANRTEQFWPTGKQSADRSAIRAIRADAEAGAFYMLRWVHPKISDEVSRRFESYRKTGVFSGLVEETDE
ncbi:hypothetical protein KTJ89_11200 [Brevibacterium sediminis]|uniref:hypothetical protein n=1 Tax=Brevibacterium sediminis TaxID=1857024 RepID=UPI002174F31C|nr:hypothetical protein [Brevibacterium sediminis]MCS4593547.1 hypothetical protein [Brevibacterium sediminis]